MNREALLIILCVLSALQLGINFNSNRMIKEMRDAQLSKVAVQYTTREIR